MLPSKCFFKPLPGAMQPYFSGLKKHFDGNIAAVYGMRVPRTCSDTTRADSVKTTGWPAWAAAHDAQAAELRLYGRLFTEAQPEAAGRNFKAGLDPGSKMVVHGWLEPWSAAANADDKFARNRFAD